MMNNDFGFATWYDGNQKSFVLEKKEDNKWEIKAGVWATGTPTSSINQIKDKKGRGSFSWLFYMPKAQVSDNLQKWSDVFSKDGTTASAVYEKDKGWKSNTSATSRKGQIPKFDKVEDLTNFCKTQGAMRKEKETEDKTLKAFCIV